MKFALIVIMVSLTEFRHRLKGLGEEGWVAMKGIFVGKRGPNVKITTGTSGIDYECQVRHVATNEKDVT